MSLHRLFLFAIVVLPLGAHAACSASNGDAIPNEVRDAGEIDSGEDFLPDGAPNPNKDGGQTNDSGPKNDSGVNDAAPDAPVVDPIVINEIYVSNQLSDGDNTEYVELRGTPGASLANLKLRILDKTGQVKYEVDVANATDVFPGDGLWAVGGGLALVDRTVLLSNWGLDNARGAVQLVRGANKDLLDVVGWASASADAGALPPPSSNPTSTGEGKPVPIPAIDGHSFGRKPAAADTNDNQADFCAMAKSASGAQKVCD